MTREAADVQLVDHCVRWVARRERRVRRSCISLRDDRAQTLACCLARNHG